MGKDTASVLGRAFARRRTIRSTCGTALWVGCLLIWFAESFLAWYVPPILGNHLLSSIYKTTAKVEVVVNYTSDSLIPNRYPTTVAKCVIQQGESHE